MREGLAHTDTDNDSDEGGDRLGRPAYSTKLDSLANVNEWQEVGCERDEMGVLVQYVIMCKGEHYAALMLRSIGMDVTTTRETDSLSVLLSASNVTRLRRAFIISLLPQPQSHSHSQP